MYGLRSRSPWKPSECGLRALSFTQSCGLRAATKFRDLGGSPILCVSVSCATKGQQTHEECNNLTSHQL